MNTANQRDLNPNVTEHLSMFYSIFTPAEKDLVMYCLYTMVVSDGHTDDKEMGFFISSAELLRYPLSKEKILELASWSPMIIYHRLKELDPLKQDWIVISLFTMLKIDGMIHPLELRVFDEIVEQFEMTKSHESYLIRLAETIMADNGIQQ